jgi:hypothetical protein
MPGVQLTVEPDVTVRFDGYRRLEIMGTLVAIGESERFIRWTNNDTSQIWNQVDVQSISTTLNRVAWCVFDAATAGLVNNESTLSIQSSYFDNCSLSGVSLADVSFADVENCIFLNQYNGAGIECRNVSGGYVHHNIFANNYKGVSCMQYAFLTIENNWIGHSYGEESSAIFMQNINSNTGDSLIVTNNQIEDCVWGIWVSGNVRLCTAIRYNNITNCSLRGINIVPETGDDPFPEIHRNNLTNINGYYIELNRAVSQTDVNAKMNWWGTTNVNIIGQDLILDGRDPGSTADGFVLFEPFLTAPEPNAGIQ